MPSEAAGSETMKGSTLAALGICQLSIAVSSGYCYAPWVFCSEVAQRNAFPPTLVLILSVERDMNGSAVRVPVQCSVYNDHERISVFIIQGR